MTTHPDPAGKHRSDAFDRVPVLDLLCAAVMLAFGLTLLYRAFGPSA